MRSRFILQAPKRNVSVSYLWLRKGEKIYFTALLQNQSPKGLLWKSCLEKICKIHKKTDENSPIFSKAAGVGLQLWQK